MNADPAVIEVLEPAQLWDVKSPQDVHPKGGYTLQDTLGQIKREVAKQENVIVNVEHLSRAHARELIAAVRRDALLAGKLLFSTSAS